MEKLAPPPPPVSAAASPRKPKSGGESSSQQFITVSYGDRKLIANIQCSLIRLIPWIKKQTIREMDILRDAMIDLVDSKGNVQKVFWRLQSYATDVFQPGSEYTLAIVEMNTDKTAAKYTSIAANGAQPQEFKVQLVDPLTPSSSDLQSSTGKRKRSSARRRLSRTQLDKSGDKLDRSEKSSSSIKSFDD